MKARAAALPVVLIVLAAAAAAYATFYDRANVSDAERGARRRDVFPSFRVEEVTRVELRRGAETLVLERPPDGAWAMTSPRREHPDVATVEVLLRDLEQAVRVRDVDPRDAPGLDDPRVRGAVKVGPLEYRFALGADAPLPDGAAYMRLDGEGTFVVDRVLKVQLLRGADAYRERALAPWGASALRRLEGRAAGGASFAIERQGVDFRVAARGLRASRAAVDRLTTALADARADLFLDDAVASHPPDPPALLLSGAPRDDADGRFELRFGGECPSEPRDVVVVRAAASPLAACVGRTVLDAFSTKDDDLVDPSPLLAHADEIEELGAEPVGRPGPRLDLARRGSGWHERSPEDRELDGAQADAAGALVAALAGAHGTDVHRPAAGETLQARTRVTVVRTGGAATEVIEVGAPAKDQSVLVRRAEDGAQLRLEGDAARRFADPALE